MTTTSTTDMQKTMNDTCQTNVSDEEHQKYLRHLQDDTTITMIPAMIFLIILAVSGLIGNCLVMFVYSQRFKQSATRILIVSIASFDLVANVLAIPGDIYDMFHIWDFNNPAFCRARLLISSFTTLSSAMALLAVAVIRYRKVCKPYDWQITIARAKVISVVVALLGVLFSIPYAILNGRQTKNTPRHGICAYECTTDDVYKGTKYPLLNYGFFLVLYLVCSVPLTVLYILIGVKAWKHSKLHGVSATVQSAVTTTAASKPSTTAENSTKTIGKSTTTEDKSSETVENIPKTADKSTKTTRKSTRTVEKLKENGNIVKSNVPGSGRNVERSISTETSGCSSGYREESEAIPSIDVTECVDQYTVRIFHDRVEIRTPMMGEFIVNLQKTATSLTCLDESNNALENENFDHTADFLVLVGEKGDGLELPNTAVQDVLEHSEENRNCNIKRLPSLTKAVNNMEETTFNDNRMVQKKLTQDDHSEMIGSVSEQDSNKLNYDTKGSCNEATIDKLALHSVASDLSQLSCDIDPVTALKWVDIVYSQDQTKSDQDINKNGTSISFRICSSNPVLQKTDWLRNIITEALNKSIAKSKHPDVVKEVKDHDNISLPILENDKAKCSDLDEGVESGSDNFGVNNARPQTRISIRKRLKELVTKGNAILKTGSTRNKVRRKPMGRTTVMLIIISAIYILGFLPHLGLMFYKFTSPESYESMTMVGLSFYNLFLRTFFINCAANPVIYSMCDLNFRKECIGLLKCSQRKRF